jgi:hypothetical protein
MTTETSMWKWLKKGTSLEVYLERHENLVASGAPDVWGYCPKGSFWLELKQSEAPKKDTSKSGIKVRPSQKIWFRKMTKLHCKTHWFLVQVDNQKYLVPGIHAELIDSFSMQHFEPFNVSNCTPVGLLQKAAKGF